MKFAIKNQPPAWELVLFRPKVPLGAGMKRLPLGGSLESRAAKRAAREANGRFMNRPYGCTTKTLVGAHHDAPAIRRPLRGGSEV